MENNLSIIEPSAIIKAYSDNLKQLLSADNDIPPVFMSNPTSLRMDTEEDKATFINALSTPTHTVEEIIDMDICVTGYLLTAGESDDEETDENSSYPRMILFLSDGETVAITSETVIRRMATLLVVYGNAPWSPPIRLIIRSVKAKKSGRTYHDIKVLSRGEE